MLLSDVTFPSAEMRLRFAIVWVVGLIAYLILILPNGYRGPWSLFEYLVFGALITSVALGSAALLGRLLFNRVRMLRPSFRYSLVALTAVIGISIIFFGLNQRISGRGENRSIVIGWFLVVLSLIEATVVSTKGKFESEGIDKSFVMRLTFGAAAVLAAFLIIFWHARQTSEEFLVPSLWEGWIIEPWFYPGSLAITFGFCFGALAVRALAHRSFRWAASYGLLAIILAVSISFQPSIYRFVCYYVPILWIGFMETAAIGALAFIFLRDAYRISAVPTDATKNDDRSFEPEIC